jgi:hypothetical protein
LTSQGLRRAKKSPAGKPLRNWTGSNNLRAKCLRRLKQTNGAYRRTRNEAGGSSFWPCC